MHLALRDVNPQNGALLDRCGVLPVASVLDPQRSISMKKKETLNFRVSAEFKRKLIEAAKKEHRSLTNYLQTALTNLWQQQEATAGRKREGANPK